MIQLPRLSVAWKPAKSVVYHIAALVAFLALMLWRLNSQPGGASPAEIATRKSSNLTDLGSNPFFAPWRLLQDLSLHINSHSLAATRLPSVILALIAVVAFYYVASIWFGRPLGFLSAVLLGTTPFFLLLSRNGTPDVMYLWLAVLVAAYVFLIRNFENLPRLSFCLIMASLLVSLYIPGFIWLLVAGLILKRQIFSQLEITRFYYYIGGGLLLLALTPLVSEVAKNPNLVKSAFLIPAHFDSPVETLKNWGWMILSLVIGAGKHTALMIGRLPILDVAQTGLILFGAYVMWARLRSQFYSLVGLVLFITLAAALNDNYNFLAIALVILSIAVAMGLRFLFIEWVHVFPRNPIPRYFAIVLMAFVVAVHVVYGVRYSLAAWPATVDTAHLYVLKLN